MRLKSITYVLIAMCLFLMGCKSEAIIDLEEIEKNECYLFINNLQSDFYEIDNECNIISSVTKTIDTIYDGSGGYTLDTVFTYTYEPVSNRTKQYLVFDYSGNCINKNTYFEVTYEIAYVLDGETEYSLYESPTPLVYYYNGYFKLENKIRVGICWPIYGYDAVVTYHVTGYQDEEPTNTLTRSFVREDFM